MVYLVVLGGVGVSMYFWPNETHRRNDRRVVARVEMNNLLGALGQYKLDTNQYPTTSQGLVALVENPNHLAEWRGPYLPNGVPSDPWGNAYVYRYPGERGDEPGLLSLGADGQPGGEAQAADIFSWKSEK